MKKRKVGRPRKIKVSAIPVKAIPETKESIAVKISHLLNDLAKLPNIKITQTQNRPTATVKFGDKAVVTQTGPIAVVYTVYDYTHAGKAL